MHVVVKLDVLKISFLACEVLLGLDPRHHLAIAEPSIKFL